MEFTIGTGRLRTGGFPPGMEKGYLFTGVTISEATIKEEEQMSYQPYSNDPRRPGYGQPPIRVSSDGQEFGAADETIKSSNAGGTYAEKQHESYIAPMGNRVDSREEVFEDTNQSRANIRYWIASVTFFVLGVLEVILLLRFLFRLLGANRANDFITFLYSLSHVFVSPFTAFSTTIPWAPLASLKPRH